MVREYLVTLLLAASLQAGVYLYLDRVMLVPAANFSQHTVYGSNQTIEPHKISTDQKYYVKLLSTGVNFFTKDNKQIKEVTLNTTDTVSYFSWVPNTHIALIGINSSTAKGTNITLKSINLDTNSYPQEPKINALPAGSKIDDVAFSPQVNVAYMLITGTATNSVYRTDANNHLSKVLTSSSISRVGCLQSVDTLLFDNKQDGAVYSMTEYGSKKKISPKVGQYALIGTDKDDNIYIGKLSSPGVVSTILKGNIKGNFAEFQTLNYPYPIASIYVNYEGSLRIT